MATTNGAILPGSVGDYISALDTPGLSFTGDGDFRACVMLADYTPAAVNSIMAKRVGAGTRTWWLMVNTDGTLGFTTSADGTANITHVSTAATGATDGTVRWLRATIDVDNGAAGHDVIFYTSSESEFTDPATVTWTKLGNTVTTAGTTSLFDSTSGIELGSVGGGGTQMTGKFFYGEIRNGIAGTIVADPNILLDPTDHNVGTFSDGTNTWTLNGNVGLIANPTAHGDIAVTGVGGAVADTVVAGHGDVANTGVGDALLTAVVDGHGDNSLTGVGGSVVDAVVVGHGDIALTGVTDTQVQIVIDGHGDLSVLGVAGLILDMIVNGHGDIAFVGVGSATVVEGDHGGGGAITIKYAIGRRRPVGHRSRGIRN